MTPLELLEAELQKLIHSRDKSNKAFEEGKITKDVHEEHIFNLTPKIENYKYVIRVVTRYT